MSSLDDLRQQGFNVNAKYFADILLEGAFPKELSSLCDELLNFSIDAEELIRGGGGRAKQTQRLGDQLEVLGWGEHDFKQTKTIRLIKRKIEVFKKETPSETHKIDHILNVRGSILAIELEWNNKDTFFDRDLATLKQLHADGMIMAGIIVTRGDSMQTALPVIVENFVISNNLSLSDLSTKYSYNPTIRQANDIAKGQASGMPFAKAFTKSFVSDKFGESTTHWNKLISKLDTGAGSPCPLLAIGLPKSIIKP